MHVNVLGSDRLVTLPFVNVQSDHFVSVIYSTKLFVWYFMVKTEPGESMEWKLLLGLYYHLRNFCHSIGWEQRYFSLIWNTYIMKATMVTQNHQIISSHELRKNGGKISRFKISRFKNSKKICETQILRKVHRSGSMSGPAGPKTRISKPICSLTKRNNYTKINTWRLARRRNGIVYHILFSK